MRFVKKERIAFILILENLKKNYKNQVGPGGFIHFHEKSGLPSKWQTIIY